MKKLLLILSAVFVSVMAWAQNNSTAGLAYTLNPYAYDLSIKSWDLATRQLTVQFKLNAPPNLDDNGTNNTGPYNTGIADKEPNGIQIYAVDQSGNEYRIGGLGRDVIQKGINNGYFEYTMDLSAGTTVEFNGGTPKALPVDEPLTWKVRVKGRSNQHVDAYKVPRHVTARPTDFKRPRRVMGVGVGTNPLSPNFGRLFTSEADNGVSSNGIRDFGWLYDALYDPDYKSSHVRMPAMLEYTPQLKFVGVHKKYIDDSDNNSHFELQMYSEPHRVKVSEDGRIFVSSYHQGAGAAVKEYLGNNTFRTVIKFNASINNDNQNSTEYPTNSSKYNRRAVDFDVKGSGDDLNILVAWVKPKGSPATGNNKQWNTSIEIYEYKVGKEYDIDQTNGGTLVARYIESNPSNHLCGYLFQSYFATGYCAQRALIGVGYGSGNNDIWLKVDPGVKFTTSLKQARIIYFNKAIGDTPQKVTELDINERYEVAAWDGMPAGEFYGGGSIIVKDNKLYTYAAMTATGTAGVLRVYTINSGTLTKDKDIALGVSSPWANGFAIDYANNLYLVSEWMGDIKTISLPYSGVIETPAPANSTFSLADPVPNILATDLRYDIVRGKNQYEFSFNVNTKPEEAQLRFYKSYEDMQKSFNVVNADYYDGTNNNKPLFVYNIPSDKLKQGRIAVQLGAVAGEVDANGVITNNRLPAGVLYWSVYVKTQKSTAFAPIYKQSNTREEDKHYRLHAAVNNYPETDFFGTLNVAQYDARANSPKKSLMIYGINPDGAVEESIYTSYNRYKKRDEYINSSDNAVARFENQRHLTVAPNGMVFISDYGCTTGDETKEEVMTFANGGVKVWDPNDPTNDDKSIKLSHFESNDNQSATAVDICKKNDNLYLYRTNTYSEFATHTDLNQKPPRWEWYTKANQDDLFGWNGFKEYSLGTLTNFKTSGTSITNYALKRGDASGNFSIVAMDQGVWMCQHREHTVEIKEAMKESYADNLEAYLLSFVPYNSNTRTYTSCTTMGKVWEKDGTVKEHKPYSELTQTKTSPLQSTPGSGLAYKAFKDASGEVLKEMLYVVNHDGNIVVLQITKWTNRGKETATPTVEYVRTLRTPESTKGVLKAGSGSGAKEWKTAAITSMNFDYAGNLVTTTGVAYFDMNVMKNEIDSMPEGSQNVIIYTMPYDRVNAREIQAPNSCVRIAERLAYTEDADAMATKVVENKTTYIDLYRPMSNSSFSTICLPFTYDLSQLKEGDPYYNAIVRPFAGVGLSEVGGEKVLELQFGNPVTSIEANIPYIIQPEYNITGIVQIKQQVTLTNTSGGSTPITFNDGEKENSIAFQGVIPMTEIEKSDKTLILVADNRLATVSAFGPMYGFRAYFQLASALPKGLKTKLGNKDNTVTGLIDVDGQKVNVEKFLREGRVYIRVGDSLYTITGEKVE